MTEQPLDTLSGLGRIDDNAGGDSSAIDAYYVDSFIPGPHEQPGLPADPERPIDPLSSRRAPSPSTTSGRSTASETENIEIVPPSRPPSSTSHGATTSEAGSILIVPPSRPESPTDAEITQAAPSYRPSSPPSVRFQSPSLDEHFAIPPLPPPESTGRPLEPDVEPYYRSRSRSPSLSASSIYNTIKPRFSVGSKLRDRITRSNSRNSQRKATKPPSETTAIDDETPPGLDPMSAIWPVYLKHALDEDRETLKAWNADLDSILIFAALFSAVLTTFVVESYQSLQPDPTSEVLQAILYELRVSRNASATQEPPFQVDPSSVRVNVYWFSSLVISLAAALITIMAQQWVNCLHTGLSPIPSTQARHRQYRIDGMHRWNLPAIISFLPILLHVSLLLFFAGLVDFVWDLNRTVGVVSAVLVCVTATIYVSANLLAYIYPDCPFKTSVTVFIAAIVNLSTYAYNWTCLAAISTRRAIRNVCRRTARVLREWNQDQRRYPSVEDARFRMHRTSTFPESSEALHYPSLRIASLRSQDEKFIAENKTLMDVRVLLWLVHNTDRLEKDEELGRAIIHFPHLITHRRIFIQQGGLRFLERSLQSRMSEPDATPAFLPKERRDALVVSIVNTIAVLESEVELDSLRIRAAFAPEYPMPRNPTETLFSLITPTANPAQSLLSSSTVPLVMSFLHEAHQGQLELPLLASVLRLSVRIVVTPTVLAQSGSFDPKSLVQTFLAQASYIPTTFTTSDVTSVVNTIIYLALHDVSYPNRQGYLIPVIGNARYWLDYLVHLSRQPTITGPARLQIYLALCALAWALNPTRKTGNGDTRIIEPRIPRLAEYPPHGVALGPAALPLVSCDTNPYLLCAALVTLEGILWSEPPSGAEQVRVGYAFRMERFLVALRDNLTGSRITVLEVEECIVSIARIAVYLAIFSPGTTEAMRLSLLRTLFELLKYLVVSPHAEQTAPTAGAGGDVRRGGLSRRAKVAPKLQENDVLKRWIYMACGRIVTLFLHVSPASTGLPVNPSELLFPDNSSTAVASALIEPLEPSDTAGALGSFRSISDREPVQDTFFAILQDVLVRGMLPMPGTKPEADVATWDWEAMRIAAEFISQGGLHRLLDLAANDASTGHRVLMPVLRAVRALLQVDIDVLDESHPLQRIPMHDERHPKSLLLTALQKQHPSSCQVLTGWILQGSSVHSDMEELLVEFIRMSGGLALHRPSGTEHVVDSAVLNDLLPFMSAALVADTGTTWGSRHPRLRRHAWGTLGSVVHLYMSRYPQPTTSEDPEPNPAPPFHFDDADPERTAVGLISALTLLEITEGPSAELNRHCALCEGVQLHEYARFLLLLSDESPLGGSTYKVLRKTVAAALTAIAALWMCEDAEAEAVRECLLRHDLAATLESFLPLRTDVGSEIAREILLRIARRGEGVGEASHDRNP